VRLKCALLRLRQVMVKMDVKGEEEEVRQVLRQVLSPVLLPLDLKRDK